jgi:hypothetical protein
MNPVKVKINSIRKGEDDPVVMLKRSIYFSKPAQT